MATYGTDLVLVATGSDGSGGTWGEFVGWASGGTPSSDGENFIQGAASYSQTFGNTSTGKSIAFDAGSDISGSIPTNDVVMGWVFIGAATNLYSYASGGWRFGIGASLTNFDMWYISGDDRPPNPYGGWWNVAVDPRHATDATGGTGSAGAWRYFGSIIGDTTLGIRANIAKGSPHAVDGMLRGRGEIYCTGTGATFTGMAAENDLVANRWGLLQNTGGGTFLWKGLMSFGQSGTSTTFSDSNKTIVIDDCPKTFTSFNKIEVNNASSSVTLTNVAFAAKGTYAPGNFEMINNATVALTGCTFNNMGTFIFQSNATVATTTFRGCGQITSGGANLATSIVEGYEGASDSSALVYNQTSDPNGKLNNMDFTKGTASTHAIEFGTSVPSTITISGTNFSGYNASNGQTDSALYFASTGGTITVNYSNMAEPTYKSAGATIVMSSSASLTIEIVDSDGNTITDNCEVTVVRNSDTTVLHHEDDITDGSTTYSYGSGGGTICYITVMNVTGYQPKLVNNYPLPSSGTNTLTIQLDDDPFYSNP